MTITTTAPPDGVEELPDGEPSAAGDAPGERELTADTVFHILQNERRRLVIEYMGGREGRVRMRDVAEQVAAWEHDTTVERLTSKQRQRVYIPLYQNHLPKLDEEGIIDYDQSRGIVERRPPLDRLERYLDVDAPEPEATTESDDSTTDPWVKGYLGVSIVGTGLVVARTAGTELLSTVPDLLIGATILLAYVLVTLTQLGVAGLDGMT